MLTNPLCKLAFNLRSLFGQRLTILIYHQVLAEPDPMRPWEEDRESFARQLEWVKGVFNVIPLDQAVADLRNSSLPPRALSITFDDGYLNNLTEAAPILNSLDMSATFFCTSAYMNGGLMWNDRVIEAIRGWPEARLKVAEVDIDLPVSTEKEKQQAVLAVLPKLKYLPIPQREQIANRLVTESGVQLPRLMMNESEVKALRDEGMLIGGHTHTHPILKNLETTSSAEEIQLNKQLLENVLGEKINLFAYPNGKPGTDYSADHIEQVQAVGYQAAVSTSVGAGSSNSDSFQLPRFTPWDKTRARYLARLLINSFSG